ncbi:MAG: hypothetical protein SFZ23_12510 [Planctomycetota bacterium]|nr:hypothetical protein [Planctomycetota bacterium]
MQKPDNEPEGASVSPARERQLPASRAAARGRFEVVSPFKPMGDQPGAIAKLVTDLRLGCTHSTQTWS